MFDKRYGLYVAHSSNGAIAINGRMANRHGLIAGATGTGKTVTLQVLAETFCQAGVPCFMADMKGDLSGICGAGKMTGFIEKRCAEFGVESPEFAGCPVRFYDVFGEQGHPMRTTVSNMGPQLLARLLDLNETQTGILNIVFKIADDNGLLLIDMKDLRAMLDFVAKNAKAFVSEYGNITTASVGAIQRALLTLDNQGADKFFGEPAFDVFDLIQCEGGKGVMSVLAADKLMLQPKLYSTFLLWLLSDLYAQLPEVGDMDLPRLVFFFDEAHMLFDDTPKALVDKIEQVVRLIRSKGVGVYFVTQNPCDIPDDILGQLGNRVQHALRAFTPKDQKAVKAAASTFRPNPEFKTEDAIMELGTGEVLVSFLDEKGAPSVVERAKILFPLSRIGAIDDAERQLCINRSRIFGKYDNMFDRESAYEVLQAEYEKARTEAQKAAEEAEALRTAEAQAKAEEAERKAAEKEEKARRAKRNDRSTIAGILTAAVAAAATTASRQVGNQVARSISGSTRNSRLNSSKRASTKTASTARDIVGKAAGSATQSLVRSILGNLLK